MIPPIQFMHPWVLAAFAALPVIFLILRVMPPAPRLIRFPPARFFADIKPATHTSAHTPLWILLIRISILALAILALARPFINPSAPLAGAGPISIIIDNDWASAQTWRTQVMQAQDIIEQAGRSNRNIYILPTTASSPVPDKPSILSAAQAQNIIRGLSPLPWPANEKINPPDDSDIFWIGTGLAGDSLIKLAESDNSITVLGPEGKNLPVLLRPGDDSDAILEIPAGMPSEISFTINAKDRRGNIISKTNIVTAGDKHRIPVIFDLPATLRADIAQISLSTRQGAGAILLQDSNGGRKSVFILSGTSSETPFIDGTFYLRRALEPHADIVAGSMADFTQEKPDVIILQGHIVLPPADRAAIASWVENGGLLLRFADLAGLSPQDDLTPTPLRQTGRAMEGAMTWETPQSISPFPENSPYHGIDIDSSIQIRRQILADPVPGIEKITWAQLSDGTPLITGVARGKGSVVMIHTSATTDGSDLPLSGMFVKILQKTIDLAGQSQTARQQTGLLAPYLLLDGYGRLSPPPAQAKSISRGDFDSIGIDESHPPGLYGTGEINHALNLAGSAPELSGYEILPAGTKIKEYGHIAHHELRPALILAAAVLFILDWVIMIILQGGGLLVPLRRGLNTILIALLISGATPCMARENASPATDLFLGYITTESMNDISRAGLESLAEALNARTSAEVAGISALSPGDNNISLYPFLYWPITAQASALTAEERQNIQDYLNHGGMIIFDTLGTGSPSQAALQNLTEGLTIPTLQEMPADHVLSKSFYLLDPVQMYGSIWLASADTQGKDIVSPIIVINSNLARHWAASRPGISNKAQEMDIRFGINLAMYALTGNYKADQVHLPAIVERLGR